MRKICILTLSALLLGQGLVLAAPKKAPAKTVKDIVGGITIESNTKQTPAAPAVVDENAEPVSVTSDTILDIGSQAESAMKLRLPREYTIATSQDYEQCAADYAKKTVEDHRTEFFDASKNSPEYVKNAYDRGLDEACYYSELDEVRNSGLPTYTDMKAMESYKQMLEDQEKEQTRLENTARYNLRAGYGRVTGMSKGDMVVGGAIVVPFPESQAPSPFILNTQNGVQIEGEVYTNPLRDSNQVSVLRLRVKRPDALPGETDNQFDEYAFDYHAGLGMWDISRRVGHRLVGKIQRSNGSTLEIPFIGTVELGAGKSLGIGKDEAEVLPFLRGRASVGGEKCKQGQTWGVCAMGTADAIAGLMQLGVSGRAGADVLYKISREDGERVLRFGPHVSLDALVDFAGRHSGSTFTLDLKLEKTPPKKKIKHTLGR